MKIFRVAMAVAVAAGVLAAPAGAKLLVSTYNEGLEPHVELQGKATPLKNPKSMKFEISGLVQGEAKGRFKIECSLFGVRRFSRSYTVAGMTPATRTVAISPRWDECIVAKGEARYVDPFIEGQLQIRVFGKSG